MVSPIYRKRKVFASKKTFAQVIIYQMARSPKSSHPAIAAQRLSPRKQPNQPRAQETVGVILSAAEQILRDDGFTKLSTNRVAERAGVSIGSLYQYFPGKESLVAAVILKRYQEENVHFLSAMDTIKDAPVRQAVEVLVRVIVASALKEPSLKEVLDEQLDRLAHQRQVMDYLDEMVTAPLTALLQAMGGNISCPSPELSAFVLTHSIQPLLKRVTLSQYRDDQDLVSKEICALVYGYLTAQRD